MIGDLRVDVVGLLSVASALPLIVLGLLVLGVRRTPQNLFFALFSVTWGIQVATANLTRLTGDATLHDHLIRTTLLLYLATALFLTHFASLHPTRRPLAARPWGAPLLVCGVLPGALLLLVAPDRLFQIVAADPPEAAYQALAGPLVFAPFFLAFYYAAWTQSEAARTAETATARARARLVFIALSFFLSYVVAHSFVNFTWPTAHAEVQPPLFIATNTILYGGGVLLVALLAARLLWRARDRDWTMLAALLVPALVVLVQRVAAEGGVALETGWFWRLAAVALLAYAIARYQLFELDVRFHRAVLAAVPLGIAALTIAVFAAMVEHPSRGWSLPLLFALGLVGNLTAWRYRDRLADRFLLLGDQNADSAYRTHRRYEVYRDALVQDGRLVAAEDRTLRRLRRRLDLSDREHLALQDAVRRELARSRPLPPPPDDPYPGYRVDRVIGEGSHGRALLAVRKEDGRDVVLKVVGRQALGGQAVHRLLSEAHILEGLDHPHIIRLHGIVETPEEVALVLDHAAGGSLAGVLERRGRLSLQETLRWSDDLLGALETAHAAGVLHRDLKPENVLLDRNGSVLLADFGVAARTGPDATVMPDLAAVGTLLYMAPEQVRGQDPGPQADLYGLAVLVYRMVTGTHYVPVAGRDDFQLRRLILESPPRLDPVPAVLRPVLGRALQKDAAARFPDAASFREALRAAAIARAPRAAMPATGALPAKP